MNHLYIYGFIFENEECEWLVVYRNDKTALNTILISLPSYIDSHLFYAYELNELFTDGGFHFMQHETE